MPTMSQWQMHMQLFYSAALAIMTKKNPDYTPEGVPLLELLVGCVDADIDPPQALWQLYIKHFSAIRKHFFLNKPLESETIDSRLMDATNYFAILAFYDTYRTELHAAWRAHWRSQPCECDAEYWETKVVANMCQRCRTLCWLDKRAFSLGFAPNSSGSTPKARG